MPWSSSRRLSALAVLVAVVIAPALPGWGAAAPEPPFEIRFPQETEATTFSSTFGAPRSGGRRHKGTDLMAPKMTEVYAAGDGVVTVIAASPLAGRYIEIDHGDGWSTRYIHLNNDTPGTDDGKAPWSLTVAPSVFEGSSVEAGQLIGWVGDSGNAEWTGPHTHFEIAYLGRQIDPYSLLEEAFRRDLAKTRAELGQLPEEWREENRVPS